MSSILKALKKLEEEKSAQRAGADIAKGIVKSSSMRPPKRRWLFPVSVSGAAFSAALLTYIVMGASPEHKRDAGTPEVSRKQSDAGKTDSDTNPGKSVLSGVKRLPRKGPSASADHGPVMRVQKKVPPIKSPQTKNFSSLMPENTVEMKISNEEQAQRKNVHPRVNADPGSAHKSVSLPFPVITVSGIAWNRDGSERFAVINGVPASEGMKVAGAVVERIFQDKVRFSFENRIFDVAVGGEMR